MILNHSTSKCIMAFLSFGFNYTLLFRAILLFRFFRILAFISYPLILRLFSSNRHHISLPKTMATLDFSNWDQVKANLSRVQFDYRRLFKLATAEKFNEPAAKRWIEDHFYLTLQVRFCKGVKR